ncbi:calcium uptake protein 3, mitochondrial-like isoform X3 [Ptychodera flava]|uniref:calcium uptake protein 3, mitochondrial-like isoform X3 n=1 Tax=Ptychodera flava TaxID=63121 RepID=UPI00396A2E6E
MAAAGRRLFNIIRSSEAPLRTFSSKFSKRKATKFSIFGFGGVCAAAGTLVFYVCRDVVRNPPLLPAVIAKEKENTKGKEPPRLSKKEERFQEFASCEFEGQIYMTPQDFLESVTQEEPRARIGRRKITEKELQKMLKNVPSKKKSSTQLFRSLHDQGIISYTQYLFLLCILTKPKAGFQIAFNMFDRDGNQRVDRKEFLVVEEIFGKKTDDESGESFQRQSIQGPPKTTLMIHLFGSKGTDCLDFKTFFKFMDNLQAEVLELEFLQYSKGMPVINEEEFAEILLRYTNAATADKEEYLQRLRKRISHGEVLAENGITFQEYKDFCQFLNTLDDFTIAMRMYTIANQPISQTEFKRAVKISTGHDIAPHVVNTVFQIFDKDGDGKLSHKEFIGVMKDRVHRGCRYHLIKYEGLDGWKACVKHEMKSA